MPVENYEFGGPVVGPSVLLGLLPTVVYALYHLCPPAEKHHTGPKFEPDCPGLSNLDTALQRWADQQASCTDGLFQCMPHLHLDAFVVVIGWIGLQGFLERVIPTTEVEGTKLRTGEKLKYRMNGLKAMVISFLILFFGNISYAEGKITFDRFPIEWLYDNFIATITASVVVSYGLSIALYIASFRKGALLAEGGDSGWMIYDFFMGRELNPRIPGTTFDLKCFCELRPGLIGWAVLNAAFALKERELRGSISPAMWLINLFQGVYVVDALYHEPAILTTMDITTDGFGFMLAFGDLCWVPFTYSLQARYLATHPGLESWILLGAVAILNCVGYYIFRGANSEKDAFRRDPNAPECKHLDYLKTKRGTRLLVSGWWGVARKINYTGDWLMGLSWCLVTGFDTFVTYFYAIYFAVLLVHRAIRDDEMCHKKYGADWPKYKKRVPYAFFPFSIVPSTVEGTQMLWSFLTFYLATFGAVTLLVPGKAAEFVFADGFITDNPDTLMVGLQVYALVNVVVALLVAAVGHDGGPTQGQLVAAAAGQLFLAVFLAWTHLTGHHNALHLTNEVLGVPLIVVSALFKAYLGTALLLAPPSS